MKDYSEGHEMYGHMESCMQAIDPAPMMFLIAAAFVTGIVVGAAAVVTALLL